MRNYIVTVEIQVEADHLKEAIEAVEQIGDALDDIGGYRVTAAEEGEFAEDDE